MEMKLNPEPDAFLYGNAKDGDAYYNVNVMPPQHEWRGQFKLEGYTPHATDWIIYVDGDEVARTRSREEIATALRRAVIELAHG